MSAHLCRGWGKSELPSEWSAEVEIMSAHLAGAEVNQPVCKILINTPQAFNELCTRS